MPIEAFQIALPLMKAVRTSGGGLEIVGFLGSATIMDGSVSTCRHVLEGHVNFENEVVVSSWNHRDRGVVFTGARFHPVYDFALLQGAEPPPFDQLPRFEKAVWAGTPIQAVGFNNDGVTQDMSGGKRHSVLPRIFAGNVVRVFDQPTVGRSARVAELSFPLLSGFSGGPLITQKFDKILGMAYGNVEQSIQVYKFSEYEDDGVKMSETVNRIVEYGVFHAAEDLTQWIRELRA